MNRAVSGSSGFGLGALSGSCEFHFHERNGSDASCEEVGQRHPNGDHMASWLPGTDLFLVLLLIT